MPTNEYKTLFTLDNVITTPLVLIDHLTAVLRFPSNINAHTISLFSHNVLQAIVDLGHNEGESPKPIYVIHVAHSVS